MPFGVSSTNERLLKRRRFQKTVQAMGRNDFRSQIGTHLLVGFQGTSLKEELAVLIQEFCIGGIVLFKRNVENPSQLRSLLEGAQDLALRCLGRPLRVAIDQEGGPVQRLAPPYTQLPAARDLASQGADTVSEWAAVAGRELRDSGIHINFAPVLDVVADPATHFIGARSLGSDPEEVAALGQLWIRALQQNGVSATAKHFPGLGQAQLDPHHYAPIIHWNSEEMRANDLAPFMAAIQEGVHGFMTSHALYPDLDPVWPATLSPLINHVWLRKELGFQGILFSDDLDMSAVRERYSWAEMVHQGLLASIDCFLLCQQSRHIEPFVQALWDGIRSQLALADAHRQSLGRLKNFGLDQVPKARAN
jgi:beta-N-acetylhexosaminidase